MQLLDLMKALFAGDTLGARQWVRDAKRTRFDWSSAVRPELANDELAAAAGLAELLADRARMTRPAWTAEVGSASRVFYLEKDLPRRTKERMRTTAPEPLRRRNVYAEDSFLTFPDS